MEKETIQVELSPTDVMVLADALQLLGVLMVHANAPADVLFSMKENLTPIIAQILEKTNKRILTDTTKSAIDELKIRFKDETK